MANPFDQFDEPKEANPFDRFDNLPPAGSFIENPDIQDTQQISTITGKPEQQYVATDYQPASMGTLMKAGFVDNNDSKIKLFAEARGIDPSKYKVHQGKIYFEGDDGRYYPESPKSIDGVLKQFLAGVPSELPAEAGATIGGALGGPGGAFAGGAGGEFIRKTIGRSMGDEQTGMDYAADMGMNALLGGLDATVAKTIMNAASKAKISHATKGALTDSLKNVVGDITPEQKAAGRALSRKGKNIGVDLKPHQAMDDPTLTSYYEMLRQNPKMARQVIGSDKALESQVETAGNDLLQKIYKGETSPFEVGSELSDAGTQIIQKAKQTRTNAVSPLYQASESIDAGDISPILDKISDIKASSRPGLPVHDSMIQIENILKASDENPTIGVLDQVKKLLDAKVNIEGSRSIPPEVKKQVGDVLSMVRGISEKVSRDYKVGKALYASASPKINKMEAGILGKLSGLKKDSTKEAAIKNIFKSTHDVKVARAAIEKENPELWRRAVAEYMRGGLEKTAKANQAGVNVVNRAGKYGQWGRLEKKRLKAATEGMLDGDGEPLYNRINDFFEVMEAASIGHKTNSTTSSQQQFKKELGGIAAKAGDVVTGIRQGIANALFKNAETKTFDKNAQKLLDLMQTPEGVELIARAKGFGPGTKKGFEALATFVLMATEKNIDDATNLYQAIQDQPSLNQGL